MACPGANALARSSAQPIIFSEGSGSRRHHNPAPRTPPLITVLTPMRGKCTHGVWCACVTRYARFSTLPPHEGHIASSRPCLTPPAATAAAPSTRIGTPAAPPSRQGCRVPPKDALQAQSRGEPRIRGAPCMAPWSGAGDHGMQLVGVERYGAGPEGWCGKRSARRHVEDTWGLGSTSRTNSARQGRAGAQR
jgi:hypothetical protein